MEAARATGRARALVGFAALGIFWGTWGAELPAVKSHAQVDDAALGAALFCIGVGALAAMRPAGVLVDRLGRGVFPAMTAALAVCGFLPALATSVLGLAGALVLLGAASGSLDVAINAEAVRSEAVGRPLMRLAHGAFSLAAVASSLGAGALRAADLGPVGVFSVSSAVVLGAALVSMLLAPAPPGHETPVSLRELLRAPRPIVILGVLCALAFFVEGGWQSWSAVHLDSTLGASAALAAAGPAVFAGSAAVGRIAGQGVKLPERTLLVLAAALAAGGSVLAALAGSAGLALAGIAGAGLGTSICAPVLIGISGRLAPPERRGSAVSVVTTVAYLGFLLGPAAVGEIAHGWTLRAALVCVGGVALLLALLARRTPGAT